MGPAIAAAISLRSYLLVTALSGSQHTVRLIFRDIDLDHTWDIDTLPWDTFQRVQKRPTFRSHVTSLAPELLKAVTPYAEAVLSQTLAAEHRKVHVRSATAFLYLFLSLGSRDGPGFVYTLRSTIPIGAGLGSSASVCVCLSAALLLQTRGVVRPDPSHPPADQDQQVQTINEWAFVGELCIHGDPSGVDNTVSSGGHAVVFKRTDTKSAVTRIDNFPKLRLLLVDTKQPRSTAAQLEKVKSLRTAHPAMTETLLDGIGETVTCALNVISNDGFAGVGGGGVGGGFPDGLERLGALVRINHGLLNSMGVSHPRLERIRELVDYAGIGWTKLTGAGGGGCAMTVFRSHNEDENVRSLKQILAEEGFQTYETMLGAEGVGVLWPAVTHHGTQGDGAQEINQKMFEDALGPQEIEDVAGMGVRAIKGSWKFWHSAI
ncbi:Mevalonate kinase [Colletotrichum shisoi]|uniref:Mevalonate kinase n=1 Tax=Colletotrichum shisoi TaxID=2078593 RepID=A0A5Q4BF98_9PEZI|nr:Mevalonate kinase [Colletotrichum shisoi]